MSKTTFHIIFIVVILVLAIIIFIPNPYKKIDLYDEQIKELYTNIKKQDSTISNKTLEINSLHKENDSLIILKQKVKKIYEKEIIIINSDNTSIKQLDSVIRSNY
jgi:cell division protein FtsL